MLGNILNADYIHNDGFHYALMCLTGLFLSNENTIGPVVDLLTLVLREASRDRE